MSEINIKNLIIARDGLLGVDPEMFDMESFRKVSKHNTTLFINKDNCGTIGCAIGWCPLIEGLEPIDSDYVANYYRGIEHLDFEKYCKRVFGIREFSKVWKYLFDSNWKDIDNSIEGLIKRMDKVINGYRPLKKDIKHLS